MSNLSHSKDEFPHVSIATKMLASENGQFYADCVDLMAQLTVTGSIMEQMSIPKDATEGIYESVSWFGHSVMKHFNVSPDKLKQDILAVSLGALADF